MMRAKTLRGIVWAWDRVGAAAPADLFEQMCVLHVQVSARLASDKYRRDDGALILPLAQVLRIQHEFAVSGTVSGSDAARVARSLLSAQEMLDNLDLAAMAGVVER